MNPNLNAMPEDEGPKASCISISNDAGDNISDRKHQKNREALDVSSDKPSKDATWLQLLSPQRGNDIPPAQENEKTASSEQLSSSTDNTDMHGEISRLQLVACSESSSVAAPQQRKLRITCPGTDLGVFRQEHEPISYSASKSSALSPCQEVGRRQYGASFKLDEFPQETDVSRCNPIVLAHQVAGLEKHDPSLDFGSFPGAEVVPIAPSASHQTVVMQQGRIVEPARFQIHETGKPFETSEPTKTSICVSSSRPECEPRYLPPTEPMNLPVRRTLNVSHCELVYPPPLATHEAVLSNRHLFLETLSRLHTALGLKVCAPKVGENDVDLHKLYKEVTWRGGLEQVINDRKWKEVALAFNFPPPLTNASGILRRTYLSCLHHYEKVYFFGVQGKIQSPPGAYASRSSQLGDMNLNSEEIRPASITGTIDSAEALGVDPASSIGMTVSGAIDGKFDNGYFVTVMVGTRKMRGVLYHVPSTTSKPQHACLPALMKNVGSELTGCQKRRKSEFLRKDPNAPRQNRTGYNFFFAEQRAKLKTMKPDKDRVISKTIGELWNKLSEDEKSPYQAQGLKDKERYKREMREYKEKFQLSMPEQATKGCGLPNLARIEKSGSMLSNQASEHVSAQSSDPSKCDEESLKSAPLLLGYKDHDPNTS